MSEPEIAIAVIPAHIQSEEWVMSPYHIVFFAIYRAGLAFAPPSSMDSRFSLEWLRMSHSLDVSVPGFVGDEGATGHPASVKRVIC